MEYNANANYDYIEDHCNAAVYQEAAPYHSTGPDVSKFTKTATKTGQLRSIGNKPAPYLYEAPTTQKSRVSALNIYSTHVQHTLYMYIYYNYIHVQHSINVIIHLLYFIRERVTMNFPRWKMCLMVLVFMYLLL